MVWIPLGLQNQIKEVHKGMLFKYNNITSLGQVEIYIKHPELRMASVEWRSTNAELKIIIYEEKLRIIDLIRDSQYFCKDLVI